ncbi:MAG: SDR family NAD(P)-dependent oxidoreductase [Pyrinomonadaceae bacterium]
MWALLLAARSAVKRWREYDMRGKTVLITGGSRGLGLLLARELAQQGAHLAICARDEAELQRARADLAIYGGRVMPIKWRRH